ncbi:hypothetical protein J6590_100874 [Homalodisca vitripennis]|nr:hypothetical protein J6590_100874 [Homalodisca vitripennis]
MVLIVDLHRQRIVCDEVARQRSSVAFRVERSAHTAVNHQTNDSMEWTCRCVAVKFDLSVSADSVFLL